MTGQGRFVKCMRTRPVKILLSEGTILYLVNLRSKPKHVKVSLHKVDTFLRKLNLFKVVLLYKKVDISIPVSLLIL